MTKEFKELYKKYDDACKQFDSLGFVNMSDKTFEKKAEIYYNYKQAEQWMYKCKQALDDYKIPEKE